ncbi:MAG: hypothetical protein RL385_2476 [Pseudomonadota bacterium]|jgi:hypothetical protein
MASAKSHLKRALFSLSATMQVTGYRLKKLSTRHGFGKPPGTYEAGLPMSCAQNLTGPRGFGTSHRVRAHFAPVSALAALARGARIGFIVRGRPQFSHSSSEPAWTCRGAWS